MDPSTKCQAYQRLYTINLFGTGWSTQKKNLFLGDIQDKIQLWALHIELSTCSMICVVYCTTGNPEVLQLGRDKYLNALNNQRNDLT